MRTIPIIFQTPYIRPPTSYNTKLVPAEKLHLPNTVKPSLIVIFTTPQHNPVAIRKDSIPSRPSDVTIPSERRVSHIFPRR